MPPRGTNTTARCWSASGVSSGWNERRNGARDNFRFENCPWHHFFHSSDGEADAIAAEDVGVVGARGEAVGEYDSKPALAPHRSQRFEHLACGLGEGIEGRGHILVGERDLAAVANERDP